MTLGQSMSVVEYGRVYKQLVQQVWSLGICLSENDVLVRFILSVPEAIGEELQSRISAFDGRTQFLTLDHLVAWSQEIQDGVYVPKPNKMFRGGCTPASVCLPKCLNCGSHVNRGTCCQFSRHQSFWTVIQELRDLQLCAPVLVSQSDRPRLPHFKSRGLKRQRQLL